MSAERVREPYLVTVSGSQSDNPVPVMVLIQLDSRNQPDNRVIQLRLCSTLCLPYIPVNESSGYHIRLPA